MKLCTVFSTTLIVSALAFNSCPAAASDAKAANPPKTRASTSQTIEVKLADDEQLAHRVIKGSLGPWKEATVVLTRPKGDDDLPFKGRVLVQQAAGEARTLQLSSPNEPVDFFYLTVKSVLFRDVDRSGEKALVVLYLSHKIGSSESGYRACVNQWNGTEFERARNIEHVLFGAKSPVEVDRRLAKSKKDKK